MDELGYEQGSLSFAGCRKSMEEKILSIIDYYFEGEDRLVCERLLIEC